MKAKTIFFPAIFSMMAFCSYAQPQVSRIISQYPNSNGDSLNYKAQVYTYDVNGNQNSITFQDWDTLKLNWKNIRAYEYAYNSDQLKESEIYFVWDSIGNRENVHKSIWKYDENFNVINWTKYCWEESFWEKFSELSYEYDENNCLIFEMYVGYKDGYDIVTKKKNIYSQDCLLDTFSYQEIIQTPIDTHMTEEYFFVYNYEDNNRTIKIDLIWGGNLYPDARLIRYDDGNRLMEYIDYYTDVGPERFVYRYFADGNLQFVKHYYMDHIQWELYREEHWVYHRNYDSNGLLESQNDTVYYSYSTNFLTGFYNITKGFSYFCDGLLFTEKYSQGSWKIYEYTESADCLESEGEDLNFEFYPNPAKYWLSIKSLDLLSEKSRISIFNLEGKSVFEKKVESRSVYFEIDVSTLSAGIYFIRFENGEKYTVKKLVVSRD